MLWESFKQNEYHVVISIGEGGILFWGITTEATEIRVREEGWKAMQGDIYIYIFFFFRDIDCGFYAKKTGKSEDYKHWVTWSVWCF